MANFGFSLTPVNIFKVVGQETDWTPEQQLDCYQAAAIGQLPLSEAKAQFTFLLNRLGIQQATYRQVNGKIDVEVYNASGKATATMTDADKRKAIATKLFGDEKKSALLKDVKGDDLQTMYDANCKDKSSDAPFQMYRLCIGQHIVYRVTNDDTSIEHVAHQAVKYLVQTAKLPEKDWQTELAAGNAS